MVNLSCPAFVILILILAAVSWGLEYEDFILGRTVDFAKTDAGQIRVLEGQNAQPLKEHDVAISCVSLQPRALLLPHYMNAALVFYVHQGEAILGLVHANSILKKELRSGDVYAVPAGTVFYVLNTNNSQTLRLVGVFDTSASSHPGKLERFFVAGGTDPESTLSGFRSSVLAVAFKVSKDEVDILFGSQNRGPIIRTSVRAFDWLKSWDYLESVISNKKVKKDTKDDKKDKDDDQKKHKKDEDDKKHKDEVFNLYSTRMFENEHGWISSTVGEDVEALSGARFDVSIVKLRAGSLLAPHWNSEAAEFGLVTKGRGNIQIAFSNGTNALDAELEAGTVFHVPRFLPVCQIAAGGDEFEFVTFTVSPLFSTATNKGAQYLAGEGSVLQKLDVGILALSFDLPDHLVSGFLNSQGDEVILSGV